MTRILTILFSLVLSVSFGQTNTNYRVETENPELNKLFAGLENKSNNEILDTLFASRQKLPNGQYFTYWDKDKKIKEFAFNLKSGKVHGLFQCWNQNDILTTIGSYYLDSNWTFKKEYFLNDDTTFKIGTWRYYILQNQFDSTYYSAFIKQYRYKIPFGKDSTYEESWIYENGQKWEERTFFRGNGLVKEIIYNKDGSKYSYFEKFNNCSIEQTWDNEGRLKHININDKMRYWITLRAGEDKFFHWQLKDPENKREELYDSSGINTQTRLFYPNGNIMQFTDHKNGVQLTYDEQGNLLKMEKRKRGIWKKIK
jgi:YD repeat-containing protein